jgi:hypothetical protein
MTNIVDAREPITLSDRCDTCGAGAMVRATMLNGELYFCGHHARKLGTSLVLQAVDVYDPEGAFNFG